MDPEIEAAFAELGVTSGNRSRIVKQAILAFAEERRRQQLRDEAAHIATDPADRAETLVIHHTLGEARAR